MRLFEQMHRTRIAPKMRGEGEYAFYNSSARRPFEVYRELLNTWISELPLDVQAEMMERFRSGTEQQYEAALAEVVIHAALVRQRCSIQCHPEVPTAGKRPDFLLLGRAKEPIAYVEVTSFGPPADIVARDRREAPVYNGLDRVDLPPGWLLGYEIKKFGSRSPNIGRLKREVSSWATVVCINDTDMPQMTFEIDEWEINLTLFGGFDKNKIYERKIAAASGQVRYLTADEEIRQALALKGGRYGIESKPYIIVVADCKGELQSGDGIRDAAVEALFGSEQVVAKAFVDGSFDTRLSRARDGYWGYPENPRNRNVSAVIVLPQPNLWKLREEKWQPIRIDNPWAAHPFPTEILPLPGYKLEVSEDALVSTVGTRLADLLSLPVPWPPEE